MSRIPNSQFHFAISMHHKLIDELCKMLSALIVVAKSFDQSDSNRLHMIWEL